MNLKQSEVKKKSPAVRLNSLTFSGSRFCPELLPDDTFYTLLKDEFKVTFL